MRIKIANQTPPEPATIDDLLKAVDGNRIRIRTLASMILSVCGIMLSSSFVILFFLLKERMAVPSVTVLILLGTAAFLLVAAMMSVISALPSRPSVVYSRIEMIDVLKHLYSREYKRAIASAVFLFFGLTGFFVALVILGWSYLYSS